MSLTLYAHPFSSYCQKVLVALWENGTPFTYRHLEHPGAAENVPRSGRLDGFQSWWTMAGRSWSPASSSSI
jgi:hypothetical protein